MNFGTWNIQGIRQKIHIIASELSQTKLDIIIVTETRKKETGTNTVGEYVHIYTSVSKEKRAARGVSLLIKKIFKDKIINWVAIDENIIKLNIQLYEYNVTMVSVYAPSEYKRVAIKEEFFEKIKEIS